jgi:hypothetical protein
VSGPRLLIASAVYGSPESASVSLGWANAQRRLARDGAVDRIADSLLTNCDLVRARSRAVRVMLESEAEHLLFWDVDVVPEDLLIIRRMLECGKDLLAAPYPRKNNGGEFPVKFKPGEVQVHGGCVEVEYLPMGFTLVSRACLQTMTEHYKASLGFVDVVQNVGHETVALFQLMIRDNVLLSEDYSMCRRWRDIGGEAHIFVGDGSPLAHVGGHVFRGNVQKLADAP